MMHDRDRDELATAGKTQATSVFEKLRRDVISNVIAPGERLRVRELSARYAVGLNPVREALNRAASDGLVCLSDLKGFTAAPVSRDDLLQLTRARQLLGEVLLRESITHGDQAWEEEIVLAHYRLGRIPRYPEGKVDATVFNPAWEQAHRAYHLSLVGACGSSSLLQMEGQLFDAADRYRHLARQVALSGTPARPDQHEPLMRAVLDRDLPTAIKLLHAHYQRTAEHGLVALERFEQSRAQRRA